MVAVKTLETRGQDVVVAFRPLPPGVVKAMHTVDRPRADASPSTDVAEYGKRAARVLAEIRAALDDQEGFDGGSALGVSEDRNAFTGAHGLVVRRLLRTGHYSVPLGEILSESGRLEPEGLERFDRFRYDAYTHGLKLWIHQDAAGERLVHRAFAVASESQGSKTFWFLARLLVRPFEIEQWRPMIAM